MAISDRDLKYALYEKSVQSPEAHLELFASIYRELRGRPARRLREDFCGTFLDSCEWIRKDPANTALCLDLDLEPLSYGTRVHRRSLAAGQKRRLSVLNQSVLDPTRPRSDLIIACNFSFFIFMKRAILLRYFRSCLASLAPGGVLLLEMAGGPGMIEKTREKKSVRHGRSKFTYIWDQKSFDPIAREARYAIHFKLPGGRLLRNAFEYHWRLWTIPETRDALLEAGFKDACVYWETAHKGKGTGEYARADRGDNAYSWIAYVVGVR